MVWRESVVRAEMFDITAFASVIKVLRDPTLGVWLHDRKVERSIHFTLACLKEEHPARPLPESAENKRCLIQTPLANEGMPDREQEGAVNLGQ
jgi:hypothetical protein